jgi:hypothetical protein
MALPNGAWELANGACPKRDFLRLTLVAAVCTMAGQLHSTVSALRNRLLVIIALLSCFGGFEAKADIFTICGVDLGAAGRTQQWATFSLGGGLSDTLSDNSYVQGNVGVAGAGNITLSGNATINGDLWFHTGGTFTNKSSGPPPHHAYNDPKHDATLNQGVLDAINASAVAFNKPVTRGYASIKQIITGQDSRLNITGQGCVVMKLSDFVLTGGTFTLTGTTTDAIIINVTNSFSLSGLARFVLAGGITWDNVLFNVRKGASNVTISGMASLTGILMANNRTVAISSSAKFAVNGEVIANRLEMSDGARVRNPPPGSP